MDGIAGIVGAVVGIPVVSTFGWLALDSVLSHRRKMASPRRVLARRLAEGEISELEYLGALQLLAAVPEEGWRRDGPRASEDGQLERTGSWLA